MKKILALIIALALALSLCAVSLADDPAEVPGTVALPEAGLTFVPTELMQSAKGTIVTDGAMPIGDKMYMAYWVYFPVTPAEYAALTDYSSVSAVALFALFSFGGGMDMDTFNQAYYGGSIDTSYVHPLGSEGDTSFYLYMKPADQDYAALLPDGYREEYLALAADADRTAAAVSFSTPVASTLENTSFAFETKDLDGNPVSSADLFAQNDITLLNVWATWCGPCIGELAELQKVHERLQEKGCGIVGLLFDNDIDAAKELMAENGITYPVILAPDNLSSLYNVTAFPTSFFVGRDGNGMGTPIIGAYVEMYETELDALLQSKAK